MDNDHLDYDLPDYAAINRQITIDNIINDTDKPLIEPNVVFVTRSYKEINHHDMEYDVLIDHIREITLL